MRNTMGYAAFLFETFLSVWAMFKFEIEKSILDFEVRVKFCLALSLSPFNPNLNAFDLSTVQRKYI